MLQCDYLDLHTVAEISKSSDCNRRLIVLDCSEYFENLRKLYAPARSVNYY